MLMEQLSGFTEHECRRINGENLLRIKVSLCLLRGCVHHFSSITDVFSLLLIPKVTGAATFGTLRHESLSLGTQRGVRCSY